MGEHIKYIGLPISTVVSSVSCRARQTANLTFGGYDSQYRLLVHTGPYNEIDDDRTQILKEFYGSLPVISGGNVIVSAHNSVVKKEIFENASSDYLDIEEGGFYVISQRNGKLYLEHEFHNFASFMKIFYDR
jgi:phosphohistidine phosphatase SixA